MSTDPVANLVDVLTGWLRRLMPDEPRLDRLTADLAVAAGGGPVTATGGGGPVTVAGGGGPVTAAACGELERVAWRHARHLELHFDPAGGGTPDDEPRGWPASDPAAARARGAGVSAVRRLDDGTGLIVLDGLESWAVAQPYVDGAFALVRGSSRLVLDLRANGGGDPATVAAVAGWLLGDGAQELSEVVYRDRRRQWWTADRAPGTALTQDVALLVSGRTYSSAKALAYHLQARGRVTVVGETTRGAADHVTPIQLTPHVRGLLPEAYVRDACTGGNWEGTGVQPDLPCDAEKALDAALARAVPPTR
ncbi:MAG TPA: S41 family peptidase [Actinoplanes sp.]|nr:S41 family peptidase [Actinoplanes sp.]